MRAVAAMTLLCVVLLGLSPSAVQRIVINTSTDGLCVGNCHFRQTIVCRRANMRWSCDDGRSIAEPKISELLRAARENAAHFSLQAVGFTSSRLRSISRAAGWVIDYRNDGLSARLKREAKRLVSSPSYLRDYIASCYTTTDPTTVREYSMSLSVTITAANGESISMSSTTPRDLMIPWTISTARDTRTSYDAAISQAVLALLPNNNPARDYLSNAGLDADLETGLAFHAEQDASYGSWEQADCVL